MTLADLVARFRLLADDNKSPYLFSDADVIALLNEGEHEAVIRGRLIHESADADICQVDITSGTASYSLSPLLYEITHSSFIVDGDSTRYPIKLVSEGWLDASVSEWRDLSDTPKYGIQDDKGIRLVPTPNANGTLKLEGYRLPADDMVDDGDTPEINAAHHRHLVQWPLHVCFGIPDKETYDPPRSEKALNEFERYFGLRPDADLRRITREDVVHHVAVDFP